MTVKIIRKTAETHEVTDKMLEKMTIAGMQMAQVMNCTYFPELVQKIYKTMEAARVAESGAITRIEIDNTNHTTVFEVDGDVVIIDTDSWINKHNLRPLADALLELDKQINEWK